MRGSLRDPDSRTWGALLDGPGGMGKTSLAVRAAYDCPPGLFQRIVFVSVKDREMDDDGERPLGNLLVPGFLEMLNELARELGQPDIAKSAEDQRIRLLLDALRPARALLILDNLESLPKTDRDQLFTFVKRLPPGCKAILTSRRRIGSGFEELILEKLDQDAALATLDDLARRHPLLARTSEAERIALCLLFRNVAINASKNRPPHSFQSSLGGEVVVLEDTIKSLNHRANRLLSLGATLRPFKAMRSEEIGYTLISMAEIFSRTRQSWQRSREL